MTKTGKQKYRKTYSKRSKKWKVTNVLEPKTYPYWKALACRIMDKRFMDVQSVARKVETPVTHPQKISTSIALKPIPDTKQLVESSLSRFGKK